MLEKIQGFVTDIVRHNDRHNVVSLYTRTRGRMSFLVPVGKSKQGKTRNAIIVNMACLAADVNIRGGQELLHLSNPSAIRLWPGIYFNPIKNAVLFFVTDFCNRLLRQSPPDAKLWDFLYYSLEVLDSAPVTRIPNFHIAFLVNLLPFMGIAPSIDNGKGGYIFDMLSGTMVDPDFPSAMQRRILLPMRDSEFIPALARINYRNMHLYRFSASERQEVIDGLLRYYSLHLPLPSTLPSLDVLRDLFL